MIQKAVVYFCLLSLCTGLSVQAGTLSGDGTGVSVGQTKVTAQVVAADGTLPGDGADDGKGQGISADDTTQAEGLQQGTGSSGDAARAEGRPQAVRSGDTTPFVVLAAVFVMSGIIVVILIRRRS